MARISGFIIGFSVLLATVSTPSQSITHYKTTSNKAIHYYTVTTNGGLHSYSVTISPAMAADIVVFEPLKFKYPKPVNDGKFDNRLAFAQYHIDYNVAAHYRS